MSSNQTVSSASAMLNQFMGPTTSLNSINRAGYIVTGVVIAFALLLRRLSYIPLDPREPPLVKTTVPYYGFFLGLYWGKMGYFDSIRPPNRGIATVQFLDKSYVAWSPAIIQACMRHRNLSIKEMSEGFSREVFGIHIPKNVPPVTDDGGSQTTNYGLTGPPLFEMNVRALRTIAGTFNAVPADTGLMVPNLYHWLRQHITLATMDGVLGMENPFRADPSLTDMLFEFEGERYAFVLGKTLLKLFPGGGALGSRKAFEARETIHRHMVEYLDARNDERDDVSEFTKMAVVYFRSTGMDNDQVARKLLPAIWVSTVNTVPTMYWFTTNVLLRPQLVERLCAELKADKSETPVLKVALDKTGRRIGATINVTQLETKCPLLTSCYRETIRLANQLFGLRTVDKDATVSDEDGTTYLLKAGHIVMWSARTMHRSDKAWGNANDFDPERFMPEREADKEARTRRQSYVPFGGGRHLCPGRHFAFAENLGFLAAMILGYRVHGLKPENVQVGSGRVNDAIIQPTRDGEGGEVKLTRREGWENVQWGFEC